MNSRWQANKIGLINFWYYDEQEFPFVKGRMLLRGSNGSGKSVTMQSVVPLLLDGNMSPERLDPFGDEFPASAARTDMVVKNIAAIAASIVITVTNTAVVTRTVFLSTMISIFSVFFLICTPPYSLLSTYDIVNVTVSAYSPAAAFFQSSFLRLHHLRCVDGLICVVKHDFKCKVTWISFRIHQVHLHVFFVCLNRDGRIARYPDSCRLFPGIVRRLGLRIWILIRHIRFVLFRTFCICIPACKCITDSFFRIQTSKTP